MTARRGDSALLMQGGIAAVLARDMDRDGGLVLEVELETDEDGIYTNRIFVTTVHGRCVVTVQSEDEVLAPLVSGLASISKDLHDE